VYPFENAIFLPPPQPYNVHQQIYLDCAFSFFLLPCLFNTMDDNQHDGELIGLHNPANGRSYHQHECCGCHVRIGDLIRFKREVICVEYAVAGDPEPDFTKRR